MVYREIHGQLNDCNVPGAMAANNPKSSCWQLVWGVWLFNKRAVYYVWEVLQFAQIKLCKPKLFCSFTEKRLSPTNFSKQAILGYITFPNSLGAVRVYLVLWHVTTLFCTCMQCFFDFNMWSLTECSLKVIHHLKKKIKLFEVEFAKIEEIEELIPSSRVKHWIWIHPVSGLRLSKLSSMTVN